MYDPHALARRDHARQLVSPSPLRIWWLRWELLIASIALLLVFYVGPASFVSIPEGMRGVKFAGLGGIVEDEVWGEGVHLKAPWNSISLYDVRVHELELELPVRVDGVELEFELAVQYRLNEASLPVLHEQVGPNYEDIVVTDEVESALRELLDEVELEQIEALAARPGRLQRALRDAITDAADEFITIEGVIIRRVRTSQVSLDARAERAPTNHREAGSRVSKEMLEELEAALARADGDARVIVIVAGDD